MSTTKQFCTFEICNYVFGAPVENVQEIVMNHSVTPVPLSPMEISGLLNVRGQIVTALNLRHRLGLTENSDVKSNVHILVRGADGTVSLVADKVDDVIDVDTESVEPSPDTMEQSLRNFITGIYKTSDRLILLLDITKSLTIN